MPSSQDALLQSVTCSTCTRWRLQLGRTGHTWMWRVVPAEISAFNIHLWHHFKDFRFQKERQNEPQEGKYVVILKTDWRQAWELWWRRTRFEIWTRFPLLPFKLPLWFFYFLFVSEILDIWLCAPFSSVDD